MSPTTTNTNFTDSKPRNLRASGSRRAYLDTYAKKRSTESIKPASQHPERRKYVASIPMSYEPPYQEVAKPKNVPSAATLKALSRRAITLSRAHNVLSAPAPQQATQVLGQYPVVGSNQAGVEANLEALYKPSLTDQLAKSNSKSDSHVRTVIASALACGVISLSVFAFITRADTQAVVAQPVGAAVIEVEAPAAQTAPKGKPAAINNSYVARKPTDPVKIVISSIGVNAQVEGLGITSDGLIAVPKAYGLVGWYNKGKTVGEAGPAVMVGHYASGAGAVFDKLGSTKNGDLITVTNGKGESFTYKITKKVEYPKDKVPMKQIFKGGSESRLEIITCQGAWQGNNYDKRLVVTAELVK